MTANRMVRVLAGGILFLAAGWRLLLPQTPVSPIRFAYQPIDFTLDSCETQERHAPEPMAGGALILGAAFYATSRREGEGTNPGRSSP